MANPRVTIVFECYGPYHWARVDAVKDATVLPVQIHQRSATYGWGNGNTARTLATLLPGQSKTDFRARDLLSAWDRYFVENKVDVVCVNGWGDLGSLATLHSAIKHRKRVVVMSESSRHDANRSRFKELVKSKLIANCHAGLVGGTLARKYLHKLGVPRERVFDGYDAIDNDHYAPPSDFSRDAIRCELGFPRPYFLASNRFIEKKNLPRLIEAYASYRLGIRKIEGPKVTGSERLSTPSQSKDVTDGEKGSRLWDLVLLGDGPEKKSLVRQVQRLGLSDAVHFPGFRQYDELPKYYWGAGAFVHASTTEQWGLVINEAMAAGLPVIASSRCGATHDLVIPEKTGIRFDPYNVDELARCMQRIATDHPLRSQMSTAAIDHIANWGPERFASGLKNAVDIAMSNPRQPSTISRLAISAACRFA